VPLGSTEKMTLREIVEKHPKGIEYGAIISSFKDWPLLTDRDGKVLSPPYHQLERSGQDQLRNEEYPRRGHRDEYRYSRQYAEESGSRPRRTRWQDLQLHSNVPGQGHQAGNYARPEI